MMTQRKQVDDSGLFTKPLHEEVTSALAAVGHPDPTRWMNGAPAELTDANTPLDAQRFLINRFWRDQLGRCAENTMDVRYCLVDKGEFSSWLSLFTETVAPCIVRNNLPPAVH